MTTVNTKSKLLRLAGLALAVSLPACDGYLTVRTPTVIEVETLDPVADAPVLANSAVQNFAVAYGWLIMYSGWMAGEVDVAETFPTRNEFGRRAVDPSNGSLSTDVWFPLSQAAASSYLVLDLELPTPNTNINYQKAHSALAWSYVFMGEQFCEGAVRSGAPLTKADMADSAIAHFTSVMDIGGAANTTESNTLANAARVGRARAKLQKGDKAGALADANTVPAGFNYTLPFFDDLSNRTRVGNRMWQFTADRGSIAIAPAWRAADPRVPQRLAPSNLLPQDANYTVDRGAPYVIQDKYPGFATPIRLASKLEADYIAAEAQGTAAMLALIQARRAANGLPAYAGGTGDPAVLAEFENQRGAEFFLEGKRLGDMARNGAAVLNVPVPGATYFKPGFAPVGNQTCIPLPITETDNNPNFSQGR
jgi:starch-binding outer membrane protein, SusD/RagB family